MLDQKVYTDSAVAETLNTKFVALKVNAEKGEGQELRTKFNVEGFPTAVVVDPATQQEVDRIVGYSPPQKYLEAVKEIAAGNTFAALRKKVEANANDLDAWFLYASKLAERDDEGTTAAYQKVIALDPKDEKGKKSVAEVRLAAMALATSGEFDELIALAKKLDGKPAAIEAHETLANYLADSTEPEQEKQARASFEYLLSHGRRDADNLTGYAWFLTSRKESLEKALGLAQEAVKLEPKSLPALNALAECLYRLDRKDEAIAAARKAVAASTDPREKHYFEKRIREFETGEVEDEDEEEDEDEF